MVKAGSMNHERSPVGLVSCHLWRGMTGGKDGRKESGYVGDTLLSPQCACVWFDDWNDCCRLESFAAGGWERQDGNPLSGSLTRGWA